MNSHPPEIDLMAMRRELDEHRAKIAKLESAHATELNMESNALGVTDRRAMLKKVVGIAAGVATVGLLRPNRARANNGDPLSFGTVTTGPQGNSETSPARFAYTLGGATNSALFVFEDGASFLPSDTAFHAVLAGWASGGTAGSSTGV